MQVDIQKEEKSQIKITVTLSQEEHNEYQQKAIAELSKQLKIPGFRPGHIPTSVAESKLGKDLIKGHTIEIAIPKSYADAVINNNLQIVSKPTIDVKVEEPLKYEAIAAVLPEVKLKKDPSNIKIEKKEVKVEEKEIEETLTNLKKKTAEHEDSNDAAKNGDKVEINFDGFDEEGKEIKGTSSKNHPMVLGENTFIPGFEEKLVGMKTGEDREFDIVFPDDYHKKDFQKKKVKFKVNMIRVQNVIEPEINEAWIEKISGKKMSVAEFRKDVEENILKQKEQENKLEMENTFLDKLVEIADIELPQSLIDEEIDFMIEKTTMNLKQRGIPEDQVKKYIEEKKETLTKDYAKEAEKHVALRLILQHLFKENDVKVEDKDIDGEIEKISKAYGEQDKSQIEKYYKEDEQASMQLRNRLMLEKLFKIYIK